MSNETHQKPATPDKPASYHAETHKSLSGLHVLRCLIGGSVEDILMR